MESVLCTESTGLYLCVLSLPVCIYLHLLPIIGAI